MAIICDGLVGGDLPDIDGCTFGRCRKHSVHFYMSSLGNLKGYVSMCKRHKIDLKKHKECGSNVFSEISQIEFSVGRAKVDAGRKKTRDRYIKLSKLG